MGNCPTKDAALRKPSRALKSWINWDADRSVQRPGDCSVRAISVVSKRPYEEVYNDLYRFSKKDPGYGVETATVARYLRQRGFKVQNVHTQYLDLANFNPTEPRVVVFLEGHLTAMVNGHIVDIFDPLSRPRLRRVLGYAVNQ